MSAYWSPKLRSTFYKALASQWLLTVKDRKENKQGNFSGNATEYTFCRLFRSSRASHRKRAKSAHASLTPHRTLREGCTTCFTSLYLLSSRLVAIITRALHTRCISFTCALALTGDKLTELKRTTSVTLLYLQLTR